MILFIAGTRPELIKLAPVYRQVYQRLLDSMNPRTAVKLLLVTQQPDLVTVHNGPFDPEDVEWLDLGKPVDGREAHGLDTLYPALLEALDTWFTEYRGGLINHGNGHGHVAVIQGDTLTAKAGASVASQHGFIVCHVEAGLRSTRWDRPYPEEFTRRDIARLADIHCAPTHRAERNLWQEHVEGLVVRTGNTGVDALNDTMARLPPDTMPKTPQVLITCHRREGWDTYLPELVNAVGELANRHPEWRFVWPVHPNPLIREAVGKLSPFGNVVCSGPMDRWTFVREMWRSRVILTDSGGVVEDAVTMGRPVLILRNETERPEAIWPSSLNVLVTEDLLPRLPQMVESVLHNVMHTAVLPSAVFGDGHAAERIAHLLVGVQACPVKG